MLLCLKTRITEFAMTVLFGEGVNLVLNTCEITVINAEAMAIVAAVYLTGKPKALSYAKNVLLRTHFLCVKEESY